MAHHVFRRDILFGGLLALWKRTFGPLILLGFDEAIGSTAYDSSGNNNDVAWTQAPTALGVSGIFKEDEKAVDMTGAGWGTFAPTAGVEASNCTVVIDVRLTTATAQTFWAMEGTRKKWVLQNPTSGLGIDDNGAAYYPAFPTIIANGDRALIAWSFGALSSDLFINGIKIATAQASLAGTTHDATSYYGSEAAGVSRCGGIHPLSMLFAGETGETTHYQIWKDITGGQLHYWYETLGSLSGAFVGFDDTFDDTFARVNTPPSSIVFHAPLWEEAGAQAVDVSKNGNHATYTGGPSLGQTALTDEAVYSVLCVGTSYISAPNIVGDVFANAHTVGVIFSLPDLTTIRGVWSVGADSLNRYNAYVNTNGTITVQAYDGTNSNALTTGVVVSPNTPVRLVVKHDGVNTVTVFVDGVNAGTFSTATHTKVNTGAWLFGRSAAFNNNCTIQTPTIANVALSDADCALL